MPVLRQDPLKGEWVIIATERARRPETFASTEKAPKPALPPMVENCPFCSGNEKMTPPEVFTIDEDGTAKENNRTAGGRGQQTGAEARSNWRVRVIPNKFPALEPESSSVEEASLSSFFGESGMETMFQSFEGYGVHEVVIETPRHDRQLSNLEMEEIELVLKAFQQRSKALSGDPLLRYVQIFRNHHREAGASIEHPHCQLLALPYVPPLLEKEYERTHDYHAETGNCLLCSMLEKEEYFAKRIVAENASFIAFVPFAAPLPFTIWIVPRSHWSSLEVCPPGWEKGLAPVLQRVLVVLSKSLKDPPYNFYFHTAPLRSDSLPYYHWHLEIIPKLTIVAGLEMATGTYINVASPEEAAGFLRDGVQEVRG